MNRSMIDKVSLVLTVAPAVISTGTTNGLEVDLQGADSADLFVSTGANTGTFVGTVTLEESDTSGSGYAAVAAGDVLGSIALAGANATYKMSYIGSKRYIRAVVTRTSGTSLGVSATVVKGHLNTCPDDASYPS